MQKPRPDRSIDEAGASVVGPDLAHLLEAAALRALDRILPDSGYPAGRGSHRDRFREELRRQLARGMALGVPARGTDGTESDGSPAVEKAPEEPPGSAQGSDAPSTSSILPRPGANAPALPDPGPPPRRRVPGPQAIWNDEHSDDLEVEIESLLQSLEMEDRTRRKHGRVRPDASPPSFDRFASVDRPAPVEPEPDGRIGDARLQTFPDGDEDPPTQPAPLREDVDDPPTLPTPSDAPTSVVGTTPLPDALAEFDASRGSDPSDPTKKGTPREGAWLANATERKKRVVALLRRVYDFVLPRPEDDDPR